MRVAVLGPLRVDDAASGLERRARIVLEALVASQAKPAREDRLADAVYGDKPPSSWKTQVRICVSQIRAELGDGAIETTPGGYRLLVPPDEVDVRLFERLVGEGRKHLTMGFADRAAHVLGEALALWRGPPLTDLEGWHPGRVEIERLEELRRDVEELRLDALVRAGRHGEVLADAQAQVAEAPTREGRWMLLARAQYQAGRQADAMRTLHQARTVLTTEYGLDPGPGLVALEQAILRQDPSLQPDTVPAEPAAECPYQGLVPYDVNDADTFFGRAAAVSACRRRLAEAGVLAVVGPSGSGKSSLVRAGVAAALKRDGVSIEVVTPSPRPTDELARIRRSGRVPALVVDQCESVVTLCDDTDEQARFLDALVSHAEKAPLVVALRADRLGDLSAHAGFARLVEKGLYLMGPMAEPDLRAVIEGPAQQAGLLLEPGLVELLIRDVEGEPGALPLLSHVLRATWSRREGRTLTVAGYRDSGGIHHAVARSAEEAYGRVPTDQRPLVRDMFLRLVAPTDDGEPVRSRVPHRLIAPNPTHERLLETFVGARLVTSDESVVVLAHEALTRAWPRLREWLDEDVEGVRILRHLTVAAENWEAMGRPDSELYRGIRLDRALEWRERADPGLTATEEAFLEAGQQLAEAESRAAEAERLAAEGRAREQAVVNRRLRHLNRRLRSLLAVVVVLLVITAAAAAATTQANHRADDEARARAREASLQRLIRESLAQRSARRDLALLLATEAERWTTEAELRHGRLDAQSALFGALQAAAAPGFLGYLRHPGGEHAFTAMTVIAPDHVVAGDADGRLVRFDLSSRQPIGRPIPIGGTDDADDADQAITALATDPTGTRLVVALERSVRLIDADELVGDDLGGEAIGRTVDMPVRSTALAVSDRGAVAVSREDGRSVTVLDHATGRVRATLPVAEGRVAVAFGPDGRLAIGSGAGIELRAAGTYAALGALSRSGAAADGALRFSPDGTLLVSAAHVGIPSGQALLGSLTVWDVDRRRTAWEPPPRALCTDIAVTDDLVLCSGGAAGLHLDLTTGRPRGPASGPEPGRTIEPAFRSGMHFALSPDRATLVATAEDAAVAEVVSLDGRSPVGRLVGEPGSYLLNYSPDGSLLMLESATTSVGTTAVGPRYIWDTRTGRHVTDLDLAAGIFAPDGRVAAVLNDGSTWLLPLSTGDRTPLAAPHAYEISSYAFDQARHRIAVGFDDGAIEQRDLVSGEAVGATIGGDGTVDSLAYLRQGTVLAVARGEHVEFVDADSGDEVMAPVPGATVAASADGSVLVTATRDGNLTLRDPATGGKIGHTLIGGNAWNNYITISDDNARLLVTSWDGSARLFDVEAQAQIGDVMTVNVQPSSVTHIGGVISPDGEQMALATANGVQLWDLDLATWRSAACDLAGRNLTRTEWDQYLPDGEPYHRTCPQWPPPVE